MCRLALCLCFTISTLLGLSGDMLETRVSASIYAYLCMNDRVMLDALCRNNNKGENTKFSPFL